MPTSGKRKSSAGKGKAAIDRPFAPDLLRRAREIVDGYQIIVRIEDGEYVGRGLEMPESIGVGDDAVECIDETRGAMVSVVAFMLERGDAPPLPASEGQRTEQVNVRLTAEEKLELDTAAKQRGYRGVADFFRGVALAAARTPGQSVCER